MPKYCIVITITAADSAVAIRNLFGLAGGGNVGLKDYVLGRDLDPDTNVFGRYVLAVGGTPVDIDSNVGGTQEGDVLALIAFNADVSETIKTRIGELANSRPSLVRQLMFNPPLTRAQMTDRLAVEVGQELACSHYWHCKPGDDVTTGVNSGSALLIKFQPVA